MNDPHNAASMVVINTHADDIEPLDCAMRIADGSISGGLGLNGLPITNGCCNIFSSWSTVNLLYKEVLPRSFRPRKAEQLGSTFLNAIGWTFQDYENVITDFILRHGECDFNTKTTTVNRIIKELNLSRREIWSVLKESRNFDFFFDEKFKTTDELILKMDTIKISVKRCVELVRENSQTCYGLNPNDFVLALKESNRYINTVLSVHRWWNLHVQRVFPSKKGDRTIFIVDSAQVWCTDSGWFLESSVVKTSNSYDVAIVQECTGPIKFGSVILYNIGYDPEVMVIITNSLEILDQTKLSPKGGQIP